MRARARVRRPEGVRVSWSLPAGSRGAAFVRGVGSGASASQPRRHSRATATRALAPHGSSSVHSRKDSAAARTRGSPWRARGATAAADARVGEQVVEVLESLHRRGDDARVGVVERSEERIDGAEGALAALGLAEGRRRARAHLRARIAAIASRRGPGAAPPRASARRRSARSSSKREWRLASISARRSSSLRGRVPRALRSRPSRAGAAFALRLPARAAGGAPACAPGSAGSRPTVTSGARPRRPPRSAPRSARW